MPVGRATLNPMTPDARRARSVIATTMQGSLDITATARDEFVAGVVARSTAQWRWQWTWFPAGAARTW